MYPPRIGPQIGATSVVADQIASAVPLLLAGNSVNRSAWEPGIMGPDTAPWSTRNTISSVMLSEMPHRNDAMVNKRIDIAKVRTMPNRRINQPVSGTDTPFATAKEVMIQVPWSEDTPR